MHQINKLLALCGWPYKIKIDTHISHGKMPEFPSKPTTQYFCDIIMLYDINGSCRFRYWEMQPIHKKSIKEFGTENTIVIYG